MLVVAFLVIGAAISPRHVAAGGACSQDIERILGDGRAAITIDQCYRVRSSLVVSRDVTFGATGSLFIEPGNAVRFDANVSAPRDARIFDGRGQAIVSKASFVSVAWWGALAAVADGADAAPAFRAAVGSNRIYFVPPATYRLLSYVPAVIGTNTTQPIGAAVYFKNLLNVTISAYGSTFTRDQVVPYGNASAFFFFDGNKHFSLSGPTFVGDAAHALPNVVTLALVNHNAVDFDFKDVHLAGNFGSVYDQESGDGLVGDYNVDGIYENFTMDRVGEAFDLAFLKRVTLRDNRITCGDPIDASKPGRTGFSNAFDRPGLNLNTTGYLLSDTSDVEVHNNTYRGCYYANLIYSGSNYYFHDNRYEISNEERSRESRGYAVWIDYIAGGVPPNTLKFFRNDFSGYGAVIYFNTTNPRVMFKDVIFDGSNHLGRIGVGFLGSAPSSPLQITGLSIGGDGKNWDTKTQKRNVP